MIEWAYIFGHNYNTQQWYISMYNFICIILLYIEYINKSILHLILAKRLRSDEYINKSIYLKYFISVQFSSVALSCPTLCNTMDCSTPGFPVHHQLPEFTQPHVHHVSDAIRPSHPLSSPFPSAFNLSQHQGLFKWVGSLHQVAKVLELQFQH